MITERLYLLFRRTQSMTIFGNSGTAPSLTLRVLDGHGIIGSNVSEAVVGQRLTLDAQLKDTCKHPISILREFLLDSKLFLAPES